MEHRKSQGIQALRGLAALLVFFQHVNWLAGYFQMNRVFQYLNHMGVGAVGVFIFFGISGFIMIQKIDEPSLTFIYNRITRIYPGYFLALLVTGLIMLPFGIHTFPHWKTLLLLPSDEGQFIYIPYWSLIFEMFFYTCILLLGRATVFWRVSLFILWFCLAFFNSTYSPYYFMKSSYPSATELLCNFYNVYFLIGVLHFKLSQFIFKKLLLIYVLIYSTFLLVYAIIPQITTIPHYIHYMFICIITLHLFSHWNANSWLGDYLCKIGNASYGIYLIHISVGFFFVYLLQRIPLKLSYYAAFFILTLLMGVFSYLFGFIEAHCYNYLKKLTFKVAHYYQNGTIGVP